jgi:hypothetical protein
VVSSYSSGATLVLVLVVSACSDDLAASSKGNRDGGAGSGGATTSVDGAATGGAGGAAGSVTISCAGAFIGTARELLQAGTGESMASPTLGPDELEMFYTLKDSASVSHFHRSVRASKDATFPDGAPVPELDAACALTSDERHMDLSYDGLRAYVICAPDAVPSSGSLRVARRAAIGSPFALDPSTFGTVGQSIAIAKDELTAYSTTLSRPGPPLMYTRGSTTSPFAPGIPIPGLETVDLEAVDPSPDGLSLFGSLDSSIIVTTRTTPSDGFGPTSTVVPRGTQEVVGAPELSQDCRSLYFIHVDTQPDPDVYSIRSLKR